MVLQTSDRQILDNVIIRPSVFVSLSQIYMLCL